MVECLTAYAPESIRHTADRLMPSRCAISTCVSPYMTLVIPQLTHYVNTVMMSMWLDTTTED
jgi:hypothetical protein